MKYLKSQKIVFSRNKKWVLTVPAKNQTWVLSWWMFNVYRKGWLIESVQYIETNFIMLVNKGLFCHLVTFTVYPLLNIQWSLYFMAYILSALKFHFNVNLWQLLLHKILFVLSYFPALARNVTQKDPYVIYS